MNEEIVRELRQVKQLLAMNVKPDAPQAERANVLLGLGFTPGEAADALGTTAAAIRAARSVAKKKKSSKKK